MKKQVLRVFLLCCMTLAALTLRTLAGSVGDGGTAAAPGAGEVYQITLPVWFEEADGEPDVDSGETARPDADDGTAALMDEDDGTAALMAATTATAEQIRLQAMNPSTLRQQ